MLYIIVYVIFELYEVEWQKSSTMEGMLQNMYRYYSKSIFLFLLMHPTFFFAISFMLFTNYNVYALILFGIKAADIGTKLILIKQIFIDKESSTELSSMLQTPIHPLLPYIGLTLYPFLVYLALFG